MNWKKCYLRFNLSENKYKNSKCAIRKAKEQSSVPNHPRKKIIIDLTTRQKNDAGEEGIVLNIKTRRNKIIISKSDEG